MTKGAAVILLLASAFTSLASTASAISVTEFSLPSGTSTPLGIAAGPDGALWFTEYNANKIGRITTSGVITEFPVTAGSQPTQIVAGADGALWYAESGSRIGRITTSGAVTDFPVGNGIAVLLAIAAGPDGNLWYSSELLVPGPGPQGRIGRITPTGAVSEFDVPAPARVAFSLAAGPDGRIWFAGVGSDSFPRSQFGVIGSLSTNGGDPQAVPLSAGIPSNITAGPDGNLWFSVRIVTSFASFVAEPGQVGKIGRISTSLSNLAEFSIPSRNSSPSVITAGADGNVWFAVTPDRVARITPDGAVTQVSLPRAETAGQPLGIAAGPDGAVWLTEQVQGRIARISNLAAICTPSSTALCLDNGRFRVETTWTNADGASGPGTAVPLGSTSTAGYFWFFSDETPEVTVKVIEGCAFDGNVWFFAGGLTNVAVEVRVTDVTAPSGPATKTYTSALGTPFTPIQDTSAFPCAPAAAPTPPSP